MHLKLVYWLLLVTGVKLIYGLGACTSSLYEFHFVN